MVTGASLTGSLVVPATARAHGGGHHGGGHHGGGHHGGGHHGGGHHGGGHHGGGHHGGCNGNAEDVVLGRRGALETLDPEEIGSWLDDDIVYQNTGMPDLVGKATIQQLYGQFMLAFESITVEIVSIVTRGPLVFTERFEPHVVAETSPVGYPGAQMAIKVAGVHEVRHGAVVRWSDHWDTRAFITTLGIDLPSP